MSDIADQELFARAGWRLKWLIPTWAAQMAMLLGLLGIFTYRLAETTEHWDEMKDAGDAPRVELVWEVTNVAFSLLALILTILEITKLASETLTAFFMLASHMVKLTVALVNLALDVVVYMQRSDRNYSIIGLAIDCGLLVATIIPSIYTSLVFRRVSRYDSYADIQRGPNEYEMAAVQVKSQGHISGQPFTDTAYPSQTTSLPLPPSISPLKSHLDRAFGWPPAEVKVQRSDSFVGMGVVAERKSAATVEGVRRDSERGLVGVGEEEEEEEDDDDKTVRGSHDGGRQIGFGLRSPGSENDEEMLLASPAEDDWVRAEFDGDGRPRGLSGS